MGFSSQSGQVIFRSQAVADTYQADTGATGVAMNLRGGSLVPSRDLLVTDPEIGSGRDVSGAYLGAVSWSGDYEFYTRLESISTLLRAALGTSATATTTGITTHTLTPLDSGTLPFLSIEEKIASGLEVFRYTDAVVNTFHLEAEANGFFMGTAGLIARKQTAGNTATVAPVWDNSPLIVGTNITITYGGVALTAKTFAFDINNNFEDDDYRLGSFYLGDLTAKSREVTGSFGIRPANSGLWRQAVYGAAAATGPQGLVTAQALVITATTYENIIGGTPTTQGSLTITIPNVVLEPYGLEPSGDDVIENDISWRAIRPNTATPICTVAVKQARATIA
jgi:hypothetical protein